MRPTVGDTSALWRRFVLSVEFNSESWDCPESAVGFIMACDVCSRGKSFSISPSILCVQPENQRNDLTVYVDSVMFILSFFGVSKTRVTCDQQRTGPFSKSQRCSLTRKSEENLNTALSPSPTFFPYARLLYGAPAITPFQYPLPLQAWLAAIVQTDRARCHPSFSPIHSPSLAFESQLTKSCERNEHQTRGSLLYQTRIPPATMSIINNDSRPTPPYHESL